MEKAGLMDMNGGPGEWPSWSPGAGLTPLEQRMLAAAAAGEPVDLGVGPFTLAEMQDWHDDRAVRALVLRHLLVDNEWPVDARGIRLSGVRISGHLDLEGGTLRCPLLLHWCYLDAAEPACLDDAIVSRLDLTGCRLTGLRAQMLTAKSVSLSRSIFNGPVWLIAAKIAGPLNCRGAQLTAASQDGDALVGDGLKATRVFLGGKFAAAGVVRLPGADIAGTLNCGGAQLTAASERGNALYGERMKVGGDVFLDEGFTASGAVCLLRADIAGQLKCRSAQLTGCDNDGRALHGDGIKVGGAVVFDGSFTAAGTISLASARADTLRWAPAEPICGQVNLEGATVRELDDDWSGDRPNGHWPAGGLLRLDGFTYGRFSGRHKPTATRRLEWIHSQYQRSAAGGTAHFATQPYEQLTAVYRQAGQDTEAGEVAIARRADLRKFGDLKPYRRFGNWFLDKTIKYGYQTWRAAAYLAIVFVAFLALSIVGQHRQLIVPVGNIHGLRPVPSATQCTSDYPCFYPFGYTIDTVIPLINVHQADFWGPDGHAAWGWVWVSLTWTATVLGWALATLLVAGYTGLVRQD